MSLIFASPKRRAGRSTVGREGRSHAKTQEVSLWSQGLMPWEVPTSPSPDRQRPEDMGLTRMELFWEAKLFKAFDEQVTPWPRFICSLGPPQVLGERELQTSHTCTPAVAHLYHTSSYRTSKPNCAWHPTRWEPLSTQKEWATDRCRWVDHRNIMVNRENSLRVSTWSSKLGKTNLQWHIYVCLGRRVRWGTDYAGAQGTCWSDGNVLSWLELWPQGPIRLSQPLNECIQLYVNHLTKEKREGKGEGRRRQGQEGKTGERKKTLSRTWITGLPLPTSLWAVRLSIQSPRTHCKVPLMQRLKWLLCNVNTKWVSVLRITDLLTYTSNSEELEWSTF